MQSGSNSGFLCDFFAQSGASVQCFAGVIHFLEQSDGKFRGRNAKFQAPEFLFRGLEFLFRGSDGKIPVQKLFRGGSGGVFPSHWNFFPDTFPVSFCRRNPRRAFPPAGFLRRECPVSRQKGQVWRGFRDILISAWRVWLRFFRAVPARRPDTRISGGENEQIVNAHRMCQWKEVRRVLCCFLLLLLKVYQIHFMARVRAGCSSRPWRCPCRASGRRLPSKWGCRPARQSFSLRLSGVATDS